jgi:hypothetical protein
MDDPKPLTGARLYLLVRVEEKLEASAQSIELVVHGST